MRRALQLLLFAFAFAVAAAAAAAPAPSRLRVEHVEEPLGVDVSRPRFSWQLDAAPASDAGDGSDATPFAGWLAAPPQPLRQAAFRVLVSTTRSCGGDVWDSGRVNSSAASATLGADAQPLESARSYWWCVGVWLATGAASPLSSPARFVTGLQRAADAARAQWVALADASPAAALYASANWSAAGDVAEAVLLLSGLGWSEAYVDGARAGAGRELDPGWTHYAARALYVALVVTPLLLAQRGNASHSLAVYAGGGHYSRFWLGGAGFPQRTAVWALLRLRLADGGDQWVASDASWRVCDQALVRGNSVYGGEEADLRVAPSPACWLPVTPLAAADAPAALSPQLFAPVRVVARLAPVRAWAPESARLLLDFGQNVAGRLRVRVNLTAADGLRLRLRHAELLAADGDALNTLNLGLAAATDRLWLRGCDARAPSLAPLQHDANADCALEWAPRFTYHGFRFAEVALEAGDAPLDAVLLGVEAEVLSSALPRTGFVGSGDDTLTQLAHNTLWAQRANLMSVPTDCPQRDERLGWLADAAVSAQEALRFFDGAAFYAGFARTIADDQDPRDGSVPDFTPDCDEEDGDPLTVCNRSYARPADPAWGSAAVLIPWFAFAASGDAALLAASYPSMLAYVNALLATANATGGVLRTGSLGDWYAVLKCDTPLVSSFHLVWNLDLVAAAAQALADAPNAQRLASAAAAARAAYNAAFYRPAARAYGDTGTQGMQAANAMPLFGGIANASLWGPVAETLANVVAAGEPLPNGTRLYAGHVTTGVTGTKVLLETLARLGRNDLALCVATQRDFPSWGFMAANNATTLWEHWDLELCAEDCSLNHIMFGSVGHWLFGAVAGLESGDRGNETLAVAYELARVDPRIANASLTYAGAKVESPRGALVAWWARTPQQDGFSLELRVPPNTPAVVYVPKLDASRPDCATGLNVSGTADWALEGDTGAECVLFVADGGGVLRVNHGRAVTAVCAAANLSWSSGNWKLLVECPARALVSAVDFASLGQPEGSCGFFAAHRCHWAGSRSAVERACLGQPACILSAADFGVDPNCSAVPPEQQWLAVQVQCAESPSA